MRITDIRETAIPLKSTLANSSIDFSEMTTSVVAVITDVIRDGKPVCGFAFNSTGRYACGAQMRARFIPRVLKTDPKSLLNEAGDNLAPEKILAVMMQNEKSGGHSERSLASAPSRSRCGTRSPRSQACRCTGCWPSVTTMAKRPTKSFATSAAAGTRPARPRGTCRTRCAAISTPATRW
jgi:hypothetical protein